MSIVAKRAALGVLRPLLALLGAFLLGAVVIALSQKSISAPAAAYRALFAGAFGDANGWSGTLLRTMPLLLTGAAVAAALQAGLFNIGAEGQMAVGALAGASVGFLLPTLPPFLLLPLCFFAAMAAGAAWAFLPAYLKVKRGTHEVITAILLNYVAQNTTRYLATNPLKDPSAQAGQTPEAAAALPRLFAAYDAHAGFAYRGFCRGFACACFAEHGLGVRNPRRRAGGSGGAGFGHPNKPGADKRDAFIRGNGGSCRGNRCAWGCAVSPVSR